MILLRSSRHVSGLEIRANLGGLPARGLLANGEGGYLLPFFIYGSQLYFPLAYRDVFAAATACRVGLGRQGLRGFYPSAQSLVFVHHVYAPCYCYWFNGRYYRLAR